AVVVGRLQHRLTPTEVREMLLEDVEMVGGRVQRRDAQLRALLTPVTVIVVATDVRDVFPSAEHADDSPGQGGLPGGGISDYSEDDRTSDPRSMHPQGVWRNPIATQLSAALSTSGFERDSVVLGAVLTLLDQLDLGQQMLSHP